MATFKDKVVIVTGASSGVGAKTALEYAKQGAKLVIGGRNEANLKKTAKSCQDHGAKAENILLVLGDVTKEADCNKIVDNAIAKFGHIDVLVNNAGSSLSGNLEQCTNADVDFMFSTHVRSTFTITKRAMPHLKKTKGSVMNVSSCLGIVPGSTLIAYGMAKAAVIHFTKCVAQDVGPSGVRVNCVTLGIIDTEIHAKQGGSVEGHPEKKAELMKQMGEMHALKRVGHVEDVANTILYLTSSAASFITGAIVPVDGGLTDKNIF